MRRRGSILVCARRWLPRIGLLLAVTSEHATAAPARAQAPPGTAPPGSATPPTWHETIEPLFQRHCQECHRVGGSAPFALVEYVDAAGWAATIAEVVAARRMPPWHADRTIGRFANDRSLDDVTLAAIVAWANGGAPAGDPAKAPPRREWPTGWSLAEPPDLVLATPPQSIPAEGTLLYQYVRLPTHLDAPRFVRAAELRSTHPEVVHHVLVFLDEPDRRQRANEPRGSDSAPAGGAAPADGSAPPLERPWRPGFNQLELMQGAKPAEVPQYLARLQELIRRDLRHGEAGGLNGYFLSGLAGGGAVTFAPDEGKFMPAGAELTFQLHYQPNGTACKSATTLALWFADGPRARALDTRAIATVAFAIPPGAANHEVAAEYRLPVAATLRSLQPHMHVRGKDFTYVVRRQDGREETLLRVPAYDFDWQHEYVLAEPLELAEGDVLRVVAHYDNSAANPANPDPTQTVWFGLQTFEEMLIGYFEVVWQPGE